MLRAIVDKMDDELWLVPVLGQITVLAVTLVLILLVGSSDQALVMYNRPATQPSLEWIAQDFSARSIWIIACAALVTGLIISTVISCAAIRQYGRERFRFAHYFAAALFVLALIFSFLDQTCGNVLIWQVIQTAPTFMGPGIHWFFHLLDAIPAVPMAYATVAMGTVASPAHPVRKNVVVDAHQRFRRLNSVLYCVAVTDVIGMAEVRALYLFIANGNYSETAKVIRELGQSLAYFVGGTTTIAFFATYLPAMMILRSRMPLQEPTEEGGESRAGEPNAARFNILERLIPAVIMVAPYLIGGPAAALLEKATAKQ